MDQPAGGGRPRPWVSSPSYEAAVQALVNARKVAGLSQRELSERVGKPRSFISKIESRERRVDIVEFIAIAKGMNMDPASLLTEIQGALSDPIQF
jgi:transcriptional regulator with XRE-family HTH domain